MSAVGPLPVADCHNDLLLEVRHLRERGHEDPFGEIWLPQLIEGGVEVQVLPVCTEEQYVGEGALRRSLVMIEEARHLAEAHSDRVAIVETAAELDAALDAGRIAFVLAIEGAEPLGHSIELFDIFYRAGIRMCSLSWNRRTMFADGIAETDTGGRLTSLGVQAVRRMEELGIIVDVSHLSRNGFFHLAEVAQKPFVASHSSCAGVQGHPRNLDDEQLAVFRETGGLVCLNAFGAFLADEPRRSDFIDHVEYALSRLAPEQVAFGADFIYDVAETIDPIFTGLLVPLDDLPWTEGLLRPTDYPALTAELAGRLGEETARRVSSENLIGFLREHLPQG